MSFLAACAVICRAEDASKQSAIPTVDSDKAYKYVSEIVSIGPKIPGSEGSAKTVAQITAHAERLKLPFEVDRWKEHTPSGELAFCNVTVHQRGREDGYIILGAHFDTKKLETVPDFAGANDGGSGTGLLMAIMESIAESRIKPRISIRYVFFDGEEAFLRYTDRDGLYGSRRMAEKLFKSGDLKKCRAVVIADMVGDKDLSIGLTSDSDPAIAKLIFSSAGKLGKGSHFTRHGGGMLDDHTPFQRHGIPSVDIIDFSYGESNRYWHTKEDTMDKISPESLKTVGDVILMLLYTL